MSSPPGPEGNEQDHARDVKQTEPASALDGSATRFDPVGYIHHHDEQPAATTTTTTTSSSSSVANTTTSGGTAESDTSTETNRDAEEDDSAAADDAVDDSEDLDEESANVRKTSSFYRRRQSMSDTRLQKVLGFPFRPLVRPLTVSDIDSCEALENSAFSKEHAATREKFEYRLTTCPELCMGLFCTVVPSIAAENGFDIETLRTAKPVETGRPDGSLSVLVAHIVSTKCIGDLVTDESMDYPKDFRTNKTGSGPTGHQPQGHTVALHSLAVHPKLHGCGLGKLIVKAYLQQIKGALLADRVSLICQDYLVRYYEKHGFQNIGKSPTQYGGGGWYDMTFIFGNGKGFGNGGSR
ncbi:uncharacterized protein B0I36DRAFT_363034 [Microdochium trichocladiopsis]|uniref:N-acetyltransferase domain-containing protein n=1 Tax=Microdochium trichocladiopsis TaxID=1682393 RepID=A0A9P8Y9B5_9PEZI|nr:uncharacterized protein B0I36DRAFT_363034 [Microdochium trichocladiopsis]KAH7031326.1 hypothetical protein B0I36DRAFT_363034 [Microdochium trichocladiopsis]